DPGGETYTARTFSSHRYDSKVINSYGHAVPRVAGQLQRTGRDAHAVVRRADFTASQDTLDLDINSAYPVSDLKRLERTFVFERGKAPALTVRDEVAFERPETFETALISWGRCEHSAPQELLITDRGGAVRVKIDT